MSFELRTVHRLAGDGPNDGLLAGAAIGCVDVLLSLARVPLTDVPPADEFKVWLSRPRSRLPPGHGGLRRLAKSGNWLAEIATVAALDLELYAMPYDDHRPVATVRPEFDSTHVSVATAR
jgi:hypothetical protein